MSRVGFKINVLLLALLVLGVYSGHFHNSFHFDDSHAVIDNPYIRSLANIPRFFVDGTTFSALPTNQSYRPIVSTTLAIDYWLSGGLDPFYFHLSTFLWFGIQLWLMHLLYKNITQHSTAHTASTVALLAVAIYALHPVNAETINYIVQRGEVLSTLGVIAGLAGYINIRTRACGLYLVPVALGALAKPPAVMFSPLLFLYILFFEEQTSLIVWQRGYDWKRLSSAFVKTLPAFIVSIGMYVLQSLLTPKSFSPGGSSIVKYLITQPFVHLHYFLSFFAPTQLSADSDWQLINSILDPRALIGILFVIAFVVAGFTCSKLRWARPISFGIFWFFIALIPTSVVPLAEVTNDHRMYFPFVGLTLAVTYAVVLAVQRRRFSGFMTYLRTSVVVSLLLVLSWGTYQRNRVWHTEESLWLDATIKSPKNGRALMNYGLTQMAKGDYNKALELFERALVITPNYSTLESNLGIVNSALHREKEAEAHFRRALFLGPDQSSSYYFYARWLNSVGRWTEAIPLLQVGISKAEGDFQARYLLMQIYADQNNLADLEQLTIQSLSLLPDDSLTLSFLAKATTDKQKSIGVLEAQLKTKPDARGFVELSLQYYNQKRFTDSIAAAQRALEYDPMSVQAYNNIGAAYAELGMWDEAITAQEHALQLDPGFELSKNNLLWAKFKKEESVSDKH